LAAGYFQTFLNYLSEIPLRFAVFGRSRKPFMKSVFLTGASSGIGLAIAKLLVAEGHEVWGTSRNLQRIPRMPQLHPVRLDLGDPRSVERVFNAALAEARHFDVLINNAGAGLFGPAELLPTETIASQFQILVFGQIQLMQLALRHMQPRGEGLIINVTSLASRLPVPFMAAYNAAKAAMASFTMSTQLELGNSRVHVVDLQPADIRTEFNQSVIKSTEGNPRYDTKIAKTWEITERNMKNAPTPDLVARNVLRLVNSVQPPPRITVGDAFQSKIAPLIFRFLPQRLRLWGLKRYYQI
jgi:NAD(P)-dependent dehydrogenase (short-subunit alcohol dehydrogenase family)